MRVHSSGIRGPPRAKLPPSSLAHRSFCNRHDRGLSSYPVLVYWCQCDAVLCSYLFVFVDEVRRWSSNASRRALSLQRPEALKGRGMWRSSHHSCVGGRAGGKYFPSHHGAFIRFVPQPLPQVSKSTMVSLDSDGTPPALLRISSGMLTLSFC